MQVAWRPGRAVEEDISVEEAVEGFSGQMICEPPKKGSTCIFWKWLFKIIDSPNFTLGVCSNTLEF